MLVQKCNVAAYVKIINDNINTAKPLQTGVYLDIIVAKTVVTQS